MTGNANINHKTSNTNDENTNNQALRKRCTDVRTRCQIAWADAAGTARYSNPHSEDVKYCTRVRSDRSPRVGTRAILVDYSHLNIQGYAVGAWGLHEDMEAGPDHALFPNVNTETEYGWDKKVRMTCPIFTGALGSTDVARKNWDHIAVGTAISGITLVCGENVCGIDPELKRDNNSKVTESPERTGGSIVTSDSIKVMANSLSG